MTKRKIDYSIFTIIICLVVFGLLMVYSASNVVAKYKYNDGCYFVKRQLIFAIIGICLLILIVNIDISKIYKYTTLIYIISLLLLILVLIPGIGKVRGGARSWIGFGAFSIQPSEFVKLSSILLVSKYLFVEEKRIKTFWSFIRILFLIMISFGLIMLQPDFGTGLVLVLSCLLLLFSAGTNIWYFVGICGLGLIGIVVLIISAPYRLNRIFAFLDPWSDPLGSGFQGIQSLFAIAPSGLFGLGFNNSMQKHFFLPEPQNDFIFAIVCEEFGWIGGIGLLFLFLILIIKILNLSFKVSNLYMKYLSIGISLNLFVQVFINVGVVIGLLPVTGITLPLISYGGSSLLLTLMFVGLALNISRYKE